MLEVGKGGQLVESLVGQIGAQLGERPPLQEREYGAPQLLEHLFPPLRRGHDVQPDFHVRLQREQIRHAQDPGVDRGRVLHLEGPDDAAAPQPEHVDVLDRAQRRFVIVQREPIEEPDVAAPERCQHPLTVVPGGPHVQPRIGAEPRKIRLHLMGRPGAVASIPCVVGVRFAIRLRHRDGHVGFRAPHAEARHLPSVVVGERVRPPLSVLASQKTIEETTVRAVQRDETSA